MKTKFSLIIKETEIKIRKASVRSTVSFKDKKKYNRKLKHSKKTEY